MDELKQYLRDLTDEHWAKFTRRFGGGDKKRAALIAEIDTPHLERIACERILELFNVKILTAEERAEERARSATEATVRQAEAASESNKLAHQANQLSHDANRLSHDANAQSHKANEIAVRAMSEARMTRVWTAVGVGVAFLALIVAIVALFK